MAEKLGTFYYEVTADGKVAINEMNNVERQMIGISERTSHRIRNAFSRMFGIGALIGIGISAVRSLYKAIGDGIGRAIDNNQALKKSLQNIQDNFAALFTRIGLWITPLIEKLAPFANLIGQMAGQNILVQNANTTTKLDDLKKWVQYWIDSGKLSNKELKQYSEILTQISAKYQIISAREKAEADALEERNKSFKKQVEDQYSNQFKSAKENADNLRNSTKAVLDGVNELIPAGSEAGEKINKLGQAVIKIAENAGKIDLSKLTASDVVSAFSSLVSVASMLADALYNMFNADTVNAQKLHISSLTAYVEKYKSALEKLNQDIAWFKKEVENEAATYDTDTAEGINKTVEAKNKLIKSNETLIESDKKAIAYAKSLYGDDLTGERKSRKDAITDLSVMKDKLAAEASKGSLTAVAAYTAFMQNYQNKINEYNAELETIETAIAAQTELGNLVGENIGYNKEIADLEQKKADLMNEQAEAAQAVADAMKEQTRELLSQQAKLGLLDVENYGDIIRAMSAFQASGLTGLDLLSAGSDLGISNQAMNNTHIGSVIYNNYTASNNSLNVNGIMSKQAGA